MTDEPRAWRVVLESIERDLLDGRLRPGDRLPGERTLSADLGVGRSSVREALRVLEVLGLIRTATGSGPSAGAIIVALPGGGMSALMRLQVAATGFAVADIVGTRLVLETAVAADLAESAPKRSLEASVGLLDVMESRTLSADEFLALDAQFHLSLAEASGNQVIAATMAGLRSSIESYVRAGASTLPSWEATSARLMLEHRDIVRAIESGDAAVARATVHSHIENYYSETNLPAHRVVGLPETVPDATPRGT
ncbi:FadR/GntR family transcriptional regulator [Mycetocola zhadangensis]|uniref:FadR family transcriptional regulator n=1 Tax=Mycetocola zhadangensis TaxID=1164595 RepID=A0A3L7J0I0_9MICO|nr:FadR/GntR family transcriptional regulator [Mycetocola zhadangensis]RLQ83910.1 FadR family transcriptional regulator [Mycetocola zhadangensis]GGE97778.1 GntR family transcriptional regulator [Mycetocola zhadangensis]